MAEEKAQEVSDKKWKPTKAMVRFLRAWANLPPNQPVTNLTLSLEACVHVRTVYSWLRKHQFVAWWAEQTEKLVTSDLAKVWRAVLLAACRGDTGAAKLFAERFDSNYKPTTKSVVEHKLPAIQEPAGQKERIDKTISRFEELRRTGDN